MLEQQPKQVGEPPRRIQGCLDLFLKALQKGKTTVSKTELFELYDSAGLSHEEIRQRVREVIRNTNKYLRPLDWSIYSVPSQSPHSNSEDYSLRKIK